jgi:hypothetical protein
MGCDQVGMTASFKEVTDSGQVGMFEQHQEISLATEILDSPFFLGDAELRLAQLFESDRTPCLKMLVVGFIDGTKAPSTD